MSAGDKGKHNPGIDEMPPQMRESAARYERTNGEKMPVNEAEAGNYREVEHPDHPHESILREAEMGAVSFLQEEEDPNEHEDYGQVTNRNMVDDPDIVTDGGYEFERMKVYSLDGTDVEEAVSAASSYDDADAYRFGEEGFALAGGRGKVNELVWEIRQELGADMTEDFFDEAPHDRVPEPENGEMIAYDDLTKIDHEGPGPYFGGSTQEVAADGSGNLMISFAGERFCHDGAQNNPSDTEGRMGM